MPEAIATRLGAGMATALEPDGTGTSVAAVQPRSLPGGRIQLGGPPCQTFSMAGGGEGRRALLRVLFGIDVIVSGRPFRPDDGDPRTWLVLEPLRIALETRPEFIVWEQVVPVGPVWDRCAEVLTKAHGYSVWTGVISAEMYGVPQTRKRKFLIARLDGKQAGPPVPTHSRYYERDPYRLDPGVLPWVSMAEALGWGVTVRPSFTVCGGGVETGGAEPFGRRAREALVEYRSSTMPNATARTEDLPAPTVAFGNDAKSVRWVYRNGNQANAAERPSDVPAPTVHFGSRVNEVRWVQRSNYTSRSAKSVPSPVPGSPPLGARELDEPSATITSKGHHWAPADTGSSSIRVTVQEAAILQSFPPEHAFAGKLGKQYLQVGNAVPPLLAKAILQMFV